MADTDKKKQKKKKGPIRTEAILPLLVVVALLIAYFNYFFDNHLRKVIEFGGTYAHGAEVNVSRLSMLWTEPGLLIQGIQITNKDKPSHNMVEVGAIKLQLLWDGLLRGKFVIPESSITNIQIDTERKRPGRVLPKKQGAEGSGLIENAADKTVDQLKKKNEENFLSDLIAIADGGSQKAQLKKLEGELKSAAKVKELEKELKAKEVEWQKRIAGLPDESELKKLDKKIKSFKFNSKNPAEIQKSLKELDAIYKDAKAKYKDVEGAKKAFADDLKKYKGSYKNLEKMVQNDINDIAKKMNIPSLDPQEITKMLLGNLVAKQLGNINKYKKMAREYMPASNGKDEKKEEELTPVERATGRNFKFLRSKSYPKFWLQKAQISSKSSEGGFSGDIEGTIIDVTDSPRHLGKPAKAIIKGDFPHSKIFGLLADITVDHTGDIAKESAAITVDKFPVSRNTLTQSKDVKFGYNKASGNSNMNVNIQEGMVDIKSKTIFSQVDYYVDSPSASMKKILQNVSQQLNNIELNVRAKGSWEDLSLHINSNLGRKLANAIKGQIQARIRQARADIENHVKGLVNKEKAKINGELTKLENKFGVSLKSKGAALKSAEAEVKKKKNEAVNKEKKKAEEKLKKKAGKELDKLKKKFKLKF